jgi:hypothetical protein
VPHADKYVVDFYRGNEKVFNGVVSTPRIRIPGSWTFRGHRNTLLAGIYEWTVRPRYGTLSRARYGEAVVRATLTVAPLPRG